MQPAVTGRTVVLATRNAAKLRELARILGVDDPGGTQVKLVDLDEFPGAPDVPESGATFEENALLKARAIAAFTGLPAVADDSGLCVDALSGMPGVLSARWAGGHGDDRANLELVLAQVTDVPGARRGAQFVPRHAWRTRQTDAVGDPIQVLAHIQLGVVDHVVCSRRRGSKQRRNAGPSEIIGVDMVGYYVLAGQQHRNGAAQPLDGQPARTVNAWNPQYGGAPTTCPQQRFGIQAPLCAFAYRRRRSALIRPGAAAITVDPRSAQVQHLGRRHVPQHAQQSACTRIAASVGRRRCQDDDTTRQSADTGLFAASVQIQQQRDRAGGPNRVCTCAVGNRAKDSEAIAQPCDNSYTDVAAADD